MAKKKQVEKDSLYNLRPLPSAGTRKRNPDEDFILRGRQTPVRLKPQNYQTNSEMTISSTGRSRKNTRTPLHQSVSFQEFSQASDEEFNQEDLALDLSEFDDGSEEELIQLHSKNKSRDEFFNRSRSTDSWFVSPVHRAPSPSIDIRKLAQKRPLEAAVLKSSIEGTIASDPNESIRKTPIRDFDLTVFRDAEDKMLSSRTLSALATPYQEDLARLRLDRLRLEEERLLKRKCLAELERIRGPKPKWYELKTSEFHREAKRNNDMLSLSGHYEDVLEYRNQLLSSLGEDNIVTKQ